MFAKTSPAPAQNQPAPPAVSPEQVYAATHLHQEATNASDAATQALLHHLDSNLAKDCPELLNASAKDLLDRIVAELSVSEPVESVGAWRYQTIPQLISRDFLYNLWETMIDFPPTGFEDYPPSCIFEDTLETKVFKLLKFFFRLPAKELH